MIGDLNLIGSLNQWPKALLTGVSGGLTLAVGAVDWYLAPELSLSLFYLAPIALSAWFVNRWTGWTMALLGTVAWSLSDSVLTADVSAAVHLWNAVVRLMVFGTFGHTLSALKAAYDREKTESRTDSLTGAANRRQFIDALEREAVRSRRYAYPLALAYLDLDNFKQVNDHWGHAAGDRVLQQIAHQTKTALRIPDLLVRLGGDEFAILMPHTDEIAAKAVLARIYRELTYLNQQSDWGVGFSIGLISCDPAPKEIEQLIHQADQLMYRVKASGKNRIEHQPFQVPQDS